MAKKRRSCLGEYSEDGNSYIAFEGCDRYRHHVEDGRFDGQGCMGQEQSMGSTMTPQTE